MNDIRNRSELIDPSLTFIKIIFIQFFFLIHCTNVINQKFYVSIFYSKTIQL